jgi:exonuclease SbcD
VLCAGLDGSRTMLRVDLVGEIDHSVSTDAFTVETSVRDGTGAAGVRVRDFTTPALDLAAVSGESAVLGAFARLVAEASAGADAGERRVLDDALRYGLQALGGAEIGLR